MILVHCPWYFWKCQSVRISENCYEIDSYSRWFSALVFRVYLILSWNKIAETQFSRHFYQPWHFHIDMRTSSITCYSPTEMSAPMPWLKIDFGLGNILPALQSFTVSSSCYFKIDKAWHFLYSNIYPSSTLGNRCSNPVHVIECWCSILPW